MRKLPPVVTGRNSVAMSITPLLMYCKFWGIRDTEDTVII